MRIGTTVVLAALALAAGGGSPAGARTLTVDEAIALALDHSLSIDAAEAGADKSRAEATEALLQFFPKLGATASYTRLEPVPYVEFDSSEFFGSGDSSGGCDDISADDLPAGWTVEMAQQMCELIMGWMTGGVDTSEPTRIEMGRANNWVVGGSLEQVVFAGGALHQSRAAARDFVRASEENVRLTRQQTVFDAESGFYQLVAARRAEQVTRSSLELVEALVTDLHNMVDVGMASRADLLAAQVQLSQARLDAMRAAHGAELAETMFKIQLGLPRDEILDLVMDGDDGADEPMPEHDELLAEALRQRPDLRGLDFTVDAMKHLSGATWASWLPAVVLLGNLNWQNPNYSNDPEWMFTANVTLAASWTIWDRGAAMTRNRAMRAQVRQARSNRQLLAEMMDVELEAAITSYQEARAELGVAREGLEQARESLRLEQERFAEGVVNRTELLQAQTGLAGAELSLLTAETQMRISRAALRKAVGMDPEVSP